MFFSALKETHFYLFHRFPMGFIFDVRVLRLEISVFHYDRPCCNEEFCTADLVLYYLPMINPFQLVSNFIILENDK